MTKELQHLVTKKAEAVAIRDAYWKGFEDGKRNSLKHNIRLMELQLESQEELSSSTNKVKCMFSKEGKCTSDYSPIRCNGIDIPKDCTYAFSTKRVMSEKEKNRRLTAAMSGFNPYDDVFKDKNGCGKGVYYKGLALGACGGSAGFLCNDCKQDVHAPPKSI